MNKLRVFNTPEYSDSPRLHHFRQRKWCPEFVGVSNDLARRAQEHDDGEGATWTAVSEGISTTQFSKTDPGHDSQNVHGEVQTQFDLGLRERYDCAT